MNRRDFLRMLGMAAPIAAAPKYFFAPIGGWHSDVIANPHNELMASTLEDLIANTAYDNFFKGGWEMRRPFIYEWKD